MNHVLPSRILVVTLLFLTMVLSESPSFAQEVSSQDREILQKVDRARYSPQAPKPGTDQVALRDLAVKFRNPTWDEDPLFRNLDVYFYWKAPRNKKFDIVGLPKAYDRKLEESRVTQFQFMIELIVKQTFEESLDRLPVSVLRDGNGEPLEPLQLERRFPEGHPILKEVYTLDEQMLPIKVVTYQREAAFTITQVQAFTDRGDGTFRLTKLESQAPGLHEIIELEYKTHDGVDITSQITVRSIPSEEAQARGVEETATVYALQVVAVNKGLPDDLFAPR